MRHRNAFHTQRCTNVYDNDNNKTRENKAIFNGDQHK